MHDFANSFTNLLPVGLGEIIPISSICRPVFLGGQSPRGAIEPMIASLILNYLLHHIGCGASGVILVEEENPAGSL